MTANVFCKKHYSVQITCDWHRITQLLSIDSVPLLFFLFFLQYFCNKNMVNLSLYCQSHAMCTSFNSINPLALLCNIRMSSLVWGWWCGLPFNHKPNKMMFHRKPTSKIHVFPCIPPSCKYPVKFSGLFFFFQIPIYIYNRNKKYARSGVFFLSSIWCSPVSST